MWQFANIDRYIENECGKTSNKRNRVNWDTKFEWMTDDKIICLDWSLLVKENKAKEKIKRRWESFHWIAHCFALSNLFISIHAYVYRIVCYSSIHWLNARQLNRDVVRSRKKNNRKWENSRWNWINYSAYQHDRLPFHVSNIFVWINIGKVERIVNPFLNSSDN